MSPHVVASRHNNGRIGDQGEPGKPSAWFLDCFCGWGTDVITVDPDFAAGIAREHEETGR